MDEPRRPFINSAIHADSFKSLNKDWQAIFAIEQDAKDLPTINVMFA